MTAKPNVDELRELARWLYEQAGELNGHLKRAAILVQSAAEWISRAADETAAGCTCGGEWVWTHKSLDCATFQTAEKTAEQTGELLPGHVECSVCRNGYRPEDGHSCCWGSNFNKEPTEKTEPRRMYELDGSGTDEKPAGAAIAESRLSLPADVKTEGEQ